MKILIWIKGGAEMNNKKKWTIASLIIIVLAVIGVIGVTVAHKTTAETLQSHEWSFTDSVGDGFTAQFQKKNMQVANWGSYTYVVDEKNQTITFKDPSKYSDGKPLKFDIQKKDKGYQLKPLNAYTKGEWGTVTLEPKN